MTSLLFLGKAYLVFGSSKRVLDADAEHCRIRISITGDLGESIGLVLHIFLTAEYEQYLLGQQ